MIKAPGELHKASTFNLDNKVRECADLLNGTVILAKLSACDMVAIDAMYYTPCLTSLYGRAARIESSPDPSPARIAMSEGIALAKLVYFIEETRNYSGTNPVKFTLSVVLRV